MSESSQLDEKIPEAAELADVSSGQAIDVHKSTDLSANSTSPATITPVNISPKKRIRFPKPEQIFPNFIRQRLGKAARPVSIIFIVVILGLIGFGLWHYSHKNSQANKSVARFSAKTVAFKVVSTTPAKNQLNVIPTTAISIQFSQPVNPQKLQGNLFITPNVAGKFSAGKTSSQVVFTPNVPFPQGTKVQVMLNGTYQSNQGAKLGASLVYGFTTALPQDGVIFQDSSGLYTTVSSLTTGKQEAYSLVFGSSVAPGVSVTLYKSDMNHLLTSLIYKNSATDGSSYPAFLNQAIATGSMQLVTAQKNLNNGDSFNVTQNSGIYLAIATDSDGNQLGHVWMDYSDFGVLARQDDQKIVLDAQSLSSNSDVPATVQIYNLQNKINQLNETNISGLTTVTVPYSPSADVVVASDGTSQALVPLSILESQGDIRVDQDLNGALSVFGVTDRPTYSTNDTVKYAGFVRTNQDALYGPAGSAPLHLYVASYRGGTPLASFTVQPDGNGMFNGSFTTDASWLNSDGSDQFQIFAASPDGNSQNDVVVTGFTVTSQANGNNNVTVSFDKSSYLPTDTIKATVTATDSNGNPVTSGSVDVHTFSEDYYENDPTANLANFNNTGIELANSPTTVQLNSSGQGTVTLNVGDLPADETSQLVTVQANLHGATSGTAGGASAIVHQGDGILSFGIGRGIVTTKSKITGRIYATHLDGTPMANATVNYALVDSGSSDTLTSGTTTTDSNGYSEMSTNVPSSVQDNSSLQLNAWINDSQNNKIQATNYYYIQDSSNTYDTSGAALEDLDVSGSSSQVSVGQKINLVINSPAALNAMVTMDRGRIYNQQMLALNQGNNNFSFTVTSSLAPSFTLTFNYFENGVYHSEGVQFTVSNSAKQASLKLTPSSGQTVTANSSTSVQVSAKGSSGNPLTTNLIATVVSNNAYNLYNQPVPDMFTSLYPTLPIMTSSSSSLASIGSGGGGRCGGGGGGLNGFTNPLGTTLLWQPVVATNSSGVATITFTLPKGKWRVSVYSMDSNTVVGSASTTITAN